jgi:hypothetical protein
MTSSVDNIATPECWLAAICSTWHISHDPTCNATEACSSLDDPVSRHRAEEAKAKLEPSSPEEKISKTNQKQRMEPSVTPPTPNAMDAQNKEEEQGITKAEGESTTPARKEKTKPFDVAVLDMLDDTSEVTLPLQLRATRIFGFDFLSMKTYEDVTQPELEITQFPDMVANEAASVGDSPETDQSDLSQCLQPSLEEKPCTIVSDDNCLSTEVAPLSTEVVPPPKRTRRWRTKVSDRYPPERTKTWYSSKGETKPRSSVEKKSTNTLDAEKGHVQPQDAPPEEPSMNERDLNQSHQPCLDKGQLYQTIASEVSNKEMQLAENASTTILDTEEAQAQPEGPPQDVSLNERDLKECDQSCLEEKPSPVVGDENTSTASAPLPTRTRSWKTRVSDKYTPYGTVTTDLSKKEMNLRSLEENESSATHDVETAQVQPQDENASTASAPLPTRTRWWKTRVSDKYTPYGTVPTDLSKKEMNLRSLIENESSATHDVETAQVQPQDETAQAQPQDVPQCDEPPQDEPVDERDVSQCQQSSMGLREGNQSSTALAPAPKMTRRWKHGMADEYSPYPTVAVALDIFKKEMKLRWLDDASTTFPNVETGQRQPPDPPGELSPLTQDPPQEKSPLIQSKAESPPVLDISRKQTEVRTSTFVRCDPEPLPVLDLSGQETKVRTSNKYEVAISPGQAIHLELDGPFTKHVPFTNSTLLQPGSLRL